MQHSSLKRRASANIAQFTVEDDQSNVFCFERRLNRAALTSFRALRYIAHSVTRHHVKSCVVALPGRDPIELF